MDGTKNYSDEELIYKIKKENSSESVEELINRHSALCIDVSKKYHSWFFSIRDDDFLDGDKNSSDWGFDLWHPLFKAGMRPKFLDLQGKK